MVGMRLVMMGVIIVVVDVECCGSFIELHRLSFEALLFGMIKSVG